MLFKFILCCAISLSASKALITNSETHENAVSNAVSLKIEKTNEEYQTILTYEDVLRSYYQKVLEKSEMVFAYEDFRDGYYSEDNRLSFFEYANSFCSEPLFSNDSEGAFTDVQREDGTRSSGDADYVLSDVQYNTTPTSEFQRRPYRQGFSYTSIKKGDLVFESRALAGIGHIGIIINKYKNSQSYGRYIQTVEALSSGVKYCFLDDLRIIDFAVKILRVVGYTTENANNACTFAENQIGASYGNPFSHTWQTNDSDHWFCSELVYAAWKRQDIDILATYDLFGNVTHPTYCWPIGIYNSFNTTVLAMPYYTYLEITLMGKEGNKWAVQITNNCSEEVRVFANKKMCFENDAINWTNLNDISSFYLDPGESFGYYFQTNWFATHITMSFVFGQIRLITYGWNLADNNGNPTMTSYHNAKEA